MGRELQKKKRRSGIPKKARKPKSDKHVFNNPIIASNWDKSQTLSQNYARLGLTARLNRITGGVEKKRVVSDSRNATNDHHSGAEAERNRLTIGGKTTTGIGRLQVAKVERDPATGRIVRIVEDSTQRQPNPLDDTLDDLDSDNDNPPLAQHAASHLPAHTTSSPQTAAVQQLEYAAGLPAKKHTRKLTENERAFVEELVDKYGENYAAMARDMKINYMQRSEGDLRRRVKKWKQEKERRVDGT